MSLIKFYSSFQMTHCTLAKCSAIHQIFQKRASIHIMALVCVLIQITGWKVFFFSLVFLFIYTRHSSLDSVWYTFRQLLIDDFPLELSLEFFLFFLHFRSSLQNSNGNTLCLMCEQIQRNDRNKSKYYRYRQRTAINKYVPPVFMYQLKLSFSCSVFVVHTTIKEHVFDSRKFESFASFQMHGHHTTKYVTLHIWIFAFGHFFVITVDCK